MTENRRIFWNVIATYGRSLYSLVIGLFCGRWALMALGETDYGLYGLVGGLAVFISFFNTILAGANARFYAISIGAAQVAEDKSAALEECRKWFNTALSVHLLLPIALVGIGYPIGVYAVEHWLTIPAERVAACVWVFRFACLTCFVSMVNVPFTAMYNAKQYIAELTIYSFITATLNVLALGYMVTHPAQWLVKYAAVLCLTSVAPQGVICLRAMRIFPECEINLKYLFDKGRIRRLGAFSGWQFLGVFCGMMRSSGLNIVINKFFGAGMNAAQTIGSSVQGHCHSLAGAMQSAFTPVITQACGAGDYRKMNTFVIRTCKFNVFLSLIFMLPLSLEISEVMRLWLKTPPAYTGGLCLCAMLLYLIGAATTGHMVAVNATGKIALYHIVLCSVNIFTIPCCVAVGLIWRNVYAIMGTVLFFEMLLSAGRIVFARMYAGTSVNEWLRFVFSPVLVVVALGVCIGGLPQLFLPASLGRICLTTIACECVLIPMLWLVIFNADEREFVRQRLLNKIFGKFKK